MKKTALLLSVLILLSGCDTTSSGKTFWVIDTRIDPNSSDAWYQIEAEKKAEGTHCVIYLEKGESVDQTTIDQFVSEFDNNIYSTVTTHFGTPTDIDNNGKIVLLLLDIKDTYQSKDDSYVGGFFYFIDLFTNDELAASGYPSYMKSNEAELLYIDVDPADPTHIDTRSTIAHEFQHLVNYSTNIFQENGDRMPTWIDEGFSMAAEAIYQDVDILEMRELWYHLDPLYTGENNVTQNKEHSIAHGYPLTVWNPYRDSDAVLNNYALSHLFFSWLRIHKAAAGDDDSFFKRITDDQDNTFQAVLNECGSLGTGSEVDTAAKMFQRFSMANILGAAKYDQESDEISGFVKETGLESYLGKNKHSGPFTLNDGVPESVADSETGGLYPGGAIYLSDSSISDWSPDDTDETTFSYALADTDSATADYEESFGTGSSGEYLTVINSDYDSTEKTAVDTNLPAASVTQQPAVTDARHSFLSGTRSGQGSTVPQGFFRRGAENGIRQFVPGRQDQE